MKREEETTHPCYKLVRKTKKHIAEEAKRFSFLYPSESKEMFFIYGAEYAEKTMLDKACEWLDNNAEKYTIDGGLAIESLIYAFKQAMKGGAE